MWAASLLGMWIGTADVLKSPPSGPCRRLRPALSTRRQVYVSDAFQTEHAQLWVLLLECLKKQRKHRWTLLLSADDWAHAKAHVDSAQVLALLSATEFAAMRAPRHVFGPAQFLEFVTHDDVEAGAIGLGNM